MNLGHGPIDAPSLAHLTPMEHELLSGRCQVHDTFRLDWSDNFYRNLTQRTSLIKRASDRLARAEAPRAAWADRMMQSSG